MSMHKLTARDGYAYLTRQVAAGDGALEPGASLTGLRDIPWVPCTPCGLHGPWTWAYTLDSGWERCLKRSQDS